MRLATNLTIVLLAICLSGCGAKVEEHFAKFFGRQAAQEIPLPTPTASTKSEVPGGDWCQVMKGLGWPNIGIKYMDVGVSARRAVLEIFDYGSQHCGWQIPTA